MRLSRLLLAAPLFALAVVAAPPAARAGDPEDFLKPSNWEGLSQYWKIDGTSVVGETTEDPKFNTFFCTKEKYGDFEMSFKVQLRDGVGNSGVQIRSEVFDAKQFKVRGPQVDIGKGYWGSLYGEGVGGMMKASDPKKIAAAVKEAEFNSYSIVAKGTRITVKVNAETMVDEDFATLPGKDAKPAPADGIIAFQIHGGYPKMKVEFKDIVFKKLK